MTEMKPRERVMTALRRGIPDRVPWLENDIEEALQERIMGTTEFTPGDLCAKLGMDGFGYHFPKGKKARAGQSMRKYGKYPLALPDGVACLSQRQKIITLLPSNGLSPIYGIASPRRGPIQSQSPGSK